MGGGGVEVGLFRYEPVTRTGVGCLVVFFFMTLSISGRRKEVIMFKCCWNHRAVEEEAGVAVVRGRPVEAGQLGTQRQLKQGPSIDHQWPVEEMVVAAVVAAEEEATDRLEFRPTSRLLI